MFVDTPPPGRRLSWESTALTSRGRRREPFTARRGATAGAAAPLPFGGVSSAFGGGISNGGPGIPSATLTVTDSVINANRLSGSAGFLVNGGGVYTESGIVRTRTVIAGNKPDDCFGC